MIEVGKQYLFITHRQDYMTYRDGSICCVIYYDSPVFWVQFDDGFVAPAFDDELYRVEEVEESGWI